MDYLNLPLGVRRRLSAAVANGSNADGAVEVARIRWTKERPRPALSDQVRPHPPLSPPSTPSASGPPEKTRYERREGASNLALRTVTGGDKSGPWTTFTERFLPSCRGTGPHRDRPRRSLTPPKSREPLPTQEARGPLAPTCGRISTPKIAHTI